MSSCLEAIESLGWWKPNVNRTVKRNLEVLIETSKSDGYPPLTGFE